jgi:hypothetical protein
MGCYAVAAMLEEPPSVASRHHVESSAGASEMAEVKREIRRAISEVDSGHTERGVGAVLFQGFNTLLKATEVERKMGALSCRCGSGKIVVNDAVTRFFDWSSLRLYSFLLC